MPDEKFTLMIYASTVQIYTLSHMGNRVKRVDKHEFISTFFNEYNFIFELEC